MGTRETHRRRSVDGTDADAKLAALKSIVQTLVREHYWEENEEEAKRRFVEMAEADLPVAMAITNELTEEELDQAFRWPRGKGEGGLPESPVIAFLTEEQRERVRVTSAAEDEGDRARSLAMEERDAPAGKSLPASERTGLAEERFVSAMVEDLVRRRGEGAAVGVGTNDERIAAMPEPWKSRTRRELERLREELGEVLGDTTGAEGNDNPTGHTPLSTG